MGCWCQRISSRGVAASGSNFTKNSRNVGTRLEAGGRTAHGPEGRSILGAAGVQGVEGALGRAGHPTVATEARGCRGAPKGQVPREGRWRQQILQRTPLCPTASFAFIKDIL